MLLITRLLIQSVWCCAGGSLLLARGGVCLLPDLSTAKKSFRETLQQGMYHVLL